MRATFPDNRAGDTTDFVQIKHRYYVVHRDINPMDIVPLGHNPLVG